jgi:hypothetical protein
LNSDIIIWEQDESGEEFSEEDEAIGSSSEVKTLVIRQDYDFADIKGSKRLSVNFKNFLKQS